MVTRVNVEREGKRTTHRNNCGSYGGDGVWGGGDKRGQSHKAKVKSQGGSGQSYQVSQGSQRE